MAASITVTPDAPRATIDVCRVSVAGGAENDAAAYDAAIYPTEPELKSYLRFVKGGVEYGRSYVFDVSSDGEHDFNDYIFPSSGSWTVTLRRADNDAQLATLGVSVS